MTKNQANKALDEAGFGVIFQEGFSDTVEKGYVISWNPSGKQEPGAQVPPSSSRLARSPNPRASTSTRSTSSA